MVAAVVVEVDGVAGGGDDAAAAAAADGVDGVGCGGGWRPLRCCM